MGRSQTNIKRQKPMGSHGVKNVDAEREDYDDESKDTKSGKQYFQTGKKYAGPNYPQKDLTGPMQYGRNGGGHAK